MPAALAFIGLLLGLIIGSLLAAGTQLAIDAEVARSGVWVHDGVAYRLVPLEPSP